MGLPYQRVVLFGTEQFGVLAARNNTVVLNTGCACWVTEILQERCAVHIERIGRAEFCGDILLSTVLIQTVLPVDQGHGAYSLHEERWRKRVRPRRHRRVRF